MLKTKDKTVGFVEESRGTGHDRMQFSLPLDLGFFFFFHSGFSGARQLLLSLFQSKLLYTGGSFT